MENCAAFAKWCKLKNSSIRVRIPDIIGLINEVENNIEMLNKKQNNVFEVLLLYLALVCFSFSGCNSVANSGGNISELEQKIAQAPVYASVEKIPEYDGNTFVVVDDNQPDFTEDEITDVAYEEYSELDELGRCGAAEASVGQEIMPTEERGAIGQVKPSGWHTVKYDFVDGKYLYNRCHLLGYQLTGENANERNLITGTRYLNVEEMLPFENLVADYVRETNNHVMYRVTPIFEGDNLVAMGVEMEAYSVEDNGEGVRFHVFCYNVQPDVKIDYATGESKLDETSSQTTSNTEETQTYILNTRTHRYHLPTCGSVEDIAKNNKETYKGRKEELEKVGYTACKRCNP